CGERGLFIGLLVFAGADDYPQCCRPHQTANVSCQEPLTAALHGNFDSEGPLARDSWAAHGQNACRLISNEKRKMSRLPRKRAMAKKRRSVRLSKAGKPPVSRKLKTKADAIDQAYFEAKRGRDSFGYLMRQTNRYFVRTLQMLIEHHGITTAQW